MWTVAAAVRPQVHWWLPVVSFELITGAVRMGKDHRVCTADIAYSHAYVDPTTNLKFQPAPLSLISAVLFEQLHSPAASIKYTGFFFGLRVSLLLVPLQSIHINAIERPFRALSFF